MRVSRQKTFVLVNSQPERKSPFLLTKGSRSLALAHLKAGLEARGVSPERIHILPDQANFKLHHFGNPEVNPETTTNSNTIKNVIIDPQNTVCCITVNTANLYQTAQISHFFRSNFPGITIVLGGSHFRREEIYDEQGKRIKDPVEHALSRDEVGLNADAVIDGDMGPFLDFATDHTGKLTDFDRPGFFHERSIERPVNILDRGYFPRDLQAVPYSIDKTNADYYFRSIMIALSGYCRNRCDFCAAHDGKLNFPLEIIIKTLTELHRMEGLTEIVLTDPNPFSGHKILSALDALGPLSGWIPKTAYLDPSLIATKNGMEFVAKLVRYGLKNLFLGVDRDTEDMAKRIGVNILGQPRSQAQLDTERAAIEKMIQTILPNLAKGLPAGLDQFHISLSAIITPFETERSAIGLIDTMEQFQSLETPQVKVHIKFNLLAPYPGTNLRKILIKQGLVTDPGEFFDFGSNFCSWDPALGRSAQLIDELTLLSSIIDQQRRQPLVPDPDENNTIFNRFRQLTAKVFSGTVDPFSPELKRSLLDEGFNI